MNPLARSTALWVVFAAGSAVAAGNACGGLEDSESTTRAAPCSPLVSPYLGVWRATERPFGKPGTSREFQLVFSSIACRRDTAGFGEQLRGRQISYQPPSKNAEARREYKSIVIAEKSPPLKNGPDCSAYDVRDVALTEENGAHYLSFRNDALLYRKTEGGASTFFAGMIWTVNQSGRMVGASNVLVKSVHRPEDSTIAETVYKHSDSSRDLVRTVVVYDVVDESFVGSRVDRTLASQDAEPTVVYETTTDGRVYREVRVTKPRSNVKVLLTVGNEIDEKTFHSELARLNRPPVPKWKGPPLP